MIVQTLTQIIGDALKAHDEVRLSTLRMLSSEFNYEKIKLQHDLTEQEEIAVIRREAKKRKEAILAYEQAGATDKANREKAELNILQEFLPPEASDEEIEKLINEAINQYMAGLPADATHQALQAGMGKVIGLVKSMNPNVDGAKVAQIVRSKLSG